MTIITLFFCKAYRLNKLFLVKLYFRHFELETRLTQRFLKYIIIDRSADDIAFDSSLYLVCFLCVLGTRDRTNITIIRNFAPDKNILLQNVDNIFKFQKAFKNLPCDRAKVLFGG